MATASQDKKLKGWRPTRPSLGARGLSARSVFHTLVERPSDAQSRILQATGSLRTSGSFASAAGALRSWDHQLKERIVRHFSVVAVVALIAGAGGWRSWCEEQVRVGSAAEGGSAAQIVRPWAGDVVRSLAPIDVRPDIDALEAQAAPATQAPRTVTSPVFARTHTLAPGDTLGAIAAANGIDVETLVWANNLQHDGALAVGRELRIPRISGLPHVVAPGDTVPAIAERYHVPVEAIELLAENQIKPDTSLIAGAELFVPGGRYELPAGLLARYGGLDQLAAHPAQLMAVVRQEQTNLRAGPGRAYPRLRQLSEGGWLLPSARHGAWLRVESAGESGWVLAELLDLPPGLPESLPETNDFPPPPPVWVWPARGALTSGFGQRWGVLHNGIDIANSAWTPIVAARAGRVFEAGWCRGFGYCVKIDHGDGMQTIYGHLVAKPSVRAGDEVEAGQRIGSMGSTYDASGGGYSTGVHLHFTVKVGGRAVDPLKYLP